MRMEVALVFFSVLLSIPTRCVYGILTITHGETERIAETRIEAAGISQKESLSAISPFKYCFFIQDKADQTPQCVLHFGFASFEIQL